jgi:O-antigen/teichoic acid export membrane protein
LILTLPFIVAGAPLLSFIFGKEFADANTPLLVLCGGAVFSSFYGSNAALLNMTKHQSRVTRASTVSIVLLGLIAPPLILVQGAIGAAIASAFSMLIWNFLMWRDAQRLLALDSSFLPIFFKTKHHV